MRRFSRPLLFTFTALIALLAVIAVALLVKKPVPAVTDDDDGDDTTDVASSAASGPHFDATFGSLASLVPQGGSAPVLLSAAPAAQAASAADSGAAAAPAGHGEQYRDLSWLQAQGDNYTLQLLGAHSEDAVKQFIAGQPDPSQFHYFQGLDGGQPWFVVVYGSYGSREQALGAAGSLPDLGLGSPPFVKAFSAYVKDQSAPAAVAATAAAPTP